MLNSLVSWKTTSIGVITILTIVAQWIQQGGVNFSDFQQIATILAGLGLIAAKDSNVTGVK